MPTIPPISPKQVVEIYAAGQAAVAKAFGRQQAALVEVQQQNEILGQKVALLEQEIARLSKDSSTSPKPPSSDLTRPPRRDQPAPGQGAGPRPGTRRERGRTASERLWTLLATCELQGRSAFAFLHQALHALWYAEPPPSLLPDTT